MQEEEEEVVVVEADMMDLIVGPMEEVSQSPSILHLSSTS